MLSDRFAAAAAHVFYRLFGLLPVDAASALGGGLGRLVGRFAGGAARQARRNLTRTLPDAPAAATLSEMWAHLGRCIAELPHLDRMAFTDQPGGRIEVVGSETLHALAADGGPALFMTGHIGNWEILPIVAQRHGVDMHLVYRAANNAAVDRLIRRSRESRVAGQIPKGAGGARQILSVLSKGGVVGMLVDQKMNDGIAAPFFSREAMTAPALAQLALRFKAKVIPAVCERLGGAHFRVTVMPPMPLPDSGDRAADVLTLTTQCNALLEQWIRARPPQWLWPHRRWPD